MFSFFGAVCTIRLPLNLEDDRSFHDAIEESHGHGPIRQILSPFFEVHVGGERGGVFLVAQGDDLVKQVSRLRAFLPLNAVTPEFVDNQKIRTRVAVQLFGKRFVRELSGQIRDQLARKCDRGRDTQGHRPFAPGLE